MAKPKRGTAGASATERASPAEEKEKHSDTRTLTNRVSIAVSSRWSCSSYNLSVSHSLDSRSPFGTCVPPPPAGGVFPTRGALGKESLFLIKRIEFAGKRTGLPKPLLTGEVASSEAWMTERFYPQVIVTMVPRWTLVPGASLWLWTRPLASPSTVQFRPAAASIWRANSALLPLTSGTSVWLPS